MDILKPKPSQNSGSKARSLAIKQKVREQKVRNQGSAKLEERVIDTSVFNSLEEWVFKQNEQTSPVSIQLIQKALEDFDILATLQQWKHLLKVGGNLLLFSFTNSVYKDGWCHQI